MIPNRLGRHSLETRITFATLVIFVSSLAAFAVKPITGVLALPFSQRNSQATSRLTTSSKLDIAATVA
jgi:hypothetical protein